jgi:hypothetical protein
LPSFVAEGICSFLRPVKQMLRYCFPFSFHASPDLNLNWYIGGVESKVHSATAATNRPIVPAPGDYDDGEIGGMMIG